MLFNSIGFILVFLPVVLVSYHVLALYAGKTPALAFLIAASLVFYGWWDWPAVFLLVGSTLFNFAAGLTIGRWRHRWLLIAGIAANLGLLAWFKYLGFLAESINALFGAHWSVGAIVLPLAISFFTFQQIAYLADVFGGAPAEQSPIRYGLFVTFFPQLIAGPIVHHGEMLPQFQQPRPRGFSTDDFALGISIFVIGLLKKVAIADTLAIPADRIFGTVALGEPVTFITAWFGTLCFGLQIYFDFSGYTDMATGLALMFSIRLPVNFNSPYKADSIVEFWRRWHMTLSRFLRDYLYIPLGGNQHGESRRLGNLILVMLLGGLWHGAAWTFVLWGGLHGLYLAINHAWRALARDRFTTTMLSRTFGRITTLVAVFFAWSLFRSESWDSAVIMMGSLTGFHGVLLPESYVDRLGFIAEFLSRIGMDFAAGSDADVYPTRNDLIMVVVILAAAQVLPNTQEWMRKTRPVLHSCDTAIGSILSWRLSALTGVVMAILCFAGLTLILRQESNAFIYFQF